MLTPYPHELLARLFGHPGVDERRLNARTAEEAMTVPAITIGADRPLAEEGTPVESVMTRGVVSCSLETPLETVAEMMASHRVHCIVGFGDVTEDDYEADRLKVAVPAEALVS